MRESRRRWSISLLATIVALSLFGVFYRPLLARPALDLKHVDGRIMTASFELGEMWSGGVRTKRYLLRNALRHSASFRVRKGCGCALATLEPSMVSDDEVSTLTVGYDSSENPWKYGHVEEVFYVHEVVGRADAEPCLKGTIDVFVKPSLRLSDSLIKFTFPPNEVTFLSQTISINNTLAADVCVKVGAEVAASEFVSITPPIAVIHSRTSFDFVVTMKGVYQDRTYSYKAEFQAENPFDSGETLTFPFSVVALPAEFVVVRPSSFMFGKSDLGGKAGKSMVIELKDNAKMISVSTSSECIALEKVSDMQYNVRVLQPSSPDFLLNEHVTLSFTHSGITKQKRIPVIILDAVPVDKKPEADRNSHK